MIDYKYEKALESDKEDIFELKKNNIKKYIETIWRWNENYQRNEFELDFKKMDEFNCIRNKEAFIGYTQIHETNEVIYIIEIHILEDYQSIGIGSSIIRNIIDYANINNKCIELGTFKENTGAIELYKRLGFEEKEFTDTHIIFQRKPNINQDSIN